MAANRVRIWDLPTRVFHWAFATLILLSWISGQFGGSDWREWHFRCGYAVLALLLFRIFWGLAGDRYALFSSYALRLTEVLAELRSPQLHAGLSPAGAVSVISMLVVSTVQVLSGLLASDDSFNEGPWAKLASDRTVSIMSSVHSINRWVLLFLVATHLAAILWYALAHRTVLVRPMLDGDKVLAGASAADDDCRIRIRAAILLALAAALSCYLALL